MRSEPKTNFGSLGGERTVITFIPIVTERVPTRGRYQKTLRMLVGLSSSSRPRRFCITKLFLPHKKKPAENRRAQQTTQQTQHGNGNKPNAKPARTTEARGNEHDSKQNRRPARRAAETAATQPAGGDGRRPHDKAQRGTGNQTNERTPKQARRHNGHARHPPQARAKPQTGTAHTAEHLRRKKQKTTSPGKQQAARGTHNTAPNA